MCLATDGRVDDRVGGVITSTGSAWSVGFGETQRTHISSKYPLLGPTQPRYLLNQTRVDVGRTCSNPDRPDNQTHAKRAQRAID